MLAFVGQLLAVPVLFFLATFGSGQGKGKLANDLTGTWVIDELKSSPWITQFGQMKLEISFTDPELRVIRDFKKDDMLTAVAGVILQAEPREKFVYFTDGRGEKNRSVFDPTVTRSVVKSMTTWDETRLWCACRVGGQDRLLTLLKPGNCHLTGKFLLRPQQL